MILFQHLGQRLRVVPAAMQKCGAPVLIFSSRPAVEENNIWVYYLFPDRKKTHDCYLIVRLIRVDIPLRSNFRVKMWHSPLETTPLLKFRLELFGSTPGSFELPATYRAPSVDQSLHKLPVNCVWLLLSRRWTCSSDAFHLGQLAAHWNPQESREGWRERL